MSLAVRDATRGRPAGIAAIYAHHVRTGARVLRDRAAGRGGDARALRGRPREGLPVARVRDRRPGGGIRLREPLPRAARLPLHARGLRSTSHPELAGGGVGRALLARLIDRCEAIGCRQLVAVIGDSGNEASIGLHSALGFEQVGTLRSIGFKHGRWVDSVLMQREIGAGDSHASRA